MPDEDDKHERIHGPEVDIGRVVGRCPGCKALLSVGKAVNPHTGRLQETLLHTMPFCSYFGETSPEEIMGAIDL